MSNGGSHHKISHPLLQFPLSSPYHKLTTPTEGRSTPLFLSTTNTLYTPIIENIGIIIGTVISQLHQKDINVSSYDTDNSSIMRRSHSFSNSHTYIHISHLNPIFNILLQINPIKEISNNLFIIYLFHLRIER